MHVYWVFLKADLYLSPYSFILMYKNNSVARFEERLHSPRFSQERKCDWKYTDIKFMFCRRRSVIRSQGNPCHIVIIKVKIFQNYWQLIVTFLAIILPLDCIVNTDILLRTSHNKQRRPTCIFYLHAVIANYSGHV